MSDLKAVTVTPVVESMFGLDGGAMFGIIPKPLWQRTNPADASNRITLATRCLVLTFDNRRVLIDAGMGDKWAPKDQAIYALQHSADLSNPDPAAGPTADTTRLRASLRASGIDPDSITDVLITHLHFDHVGGLTYHDPHGHLLPTFPTATHHVQRENWVWAHAPTLRDAGSYRAENFSLLGTPSGPPLSLLNGPCTLWDAVEVIPTRGHTPGLQMVRFRTSQHTILYVSDIIPTLGHLQLPYVMGYDLYPLTTVSEKRDALELAARHGWLIGFEHDPSCAFAHIERTSTDRYKGALASLSPQS
jgi:glyoxylase-like metal-dependent hydrolase (beta-lactamase superfamily II)